MSWLKHLLEKLFGRKEPKKDGSDIANVKCSPDMRTPSGVMPLSPAGAKALDDAFRKSNPDLVDGPEWN